MRKRLQSALGIVVGSVLPRCVESPPAKEEAGVCSRLATLQSYEGAVDASTVTRLLGDAASATCSIELSNYDRSCKVDADCTEIGVGNACALPCDVRCSNAAINVGAYPRYQTDVGNTPLFTCRTDVICGCPDYGRPTCWHGQCEERFSRADTADAAADARSAP